jgi:hypothetical protein
MRGTRLSRQTHFLVLDIRHQGQVDIVVMALATVTLHTLILLPSTRSMVPM